MAQRGLSIDEIEYVIRYGRCYYCAGARHYFLGQRQVPQAHRRYSDYSKLVGTVVLLDSSAGETVITVYRNRTAPKKIRRKAKYNLKTTRFADLPLAA